MFRPRTSLGALSRSSTSVRGYGVCLPGTGRAARHRSLVALLLPSDDPATQGRRALGLPGPNDGVGDVATDAGPEKQGPLLHSIAQAAERLGVGTSWLRTESACGRVPFRQVGGHRMFSEEDLEQIVKGLVPAQHRDDPIRPPVKPSSITGGRLCQPIEGYRPAPSPSLMGVSELLGQLRLAAQWCDVWATSTTRSCITYSYPALQPRLALDRVAATESAVTRSLADTGRQFCRATSL